MACFFSEDSLSEISAFSENFFSITLLVSIKDSLISGKLLETVRRALESSVFFSVMDACLMDSVVCCCSKSTIESSFINFNNVASSSGTFFVFLSFFVLLSSSFSKSLIFLGAVI